MAKNLTISKELQEADNKLTSALGLTNSVIMPVIDRGNKVLAVQEYLQRADVMKYVKALENTSVGYKTDGKTYSEKELSGCVTDALLHGFQLVNNEFNIIHGKMMGVLNGYLRLCRNYETETHGVRNLQIIPGEFDVQGSIVRIPLAITYDWVEKDSGQYKSLEFNRKIALTTKSNETTDSWLGKAKRRILKDFYEYLTGSYIYDDPNEDPEVTQGKTPPVGKSKKSKEPEKKQPEIDFEDAEIVEPPQHTTRPPEGEL